MPANIPLATYIGFGIGSVATGIMYRRKIVRLRNRLQHMWVDFMIDQRPPQKTEDSIELFFDEKDRQFKSFQNAGELLPPQSKEIRHETSFVASEKDYRNPQ
jgi:hypothetical protein